MRANEVRQAAAEGGILARPVSYVLKPTWLVVRWAFLGLGLWLGLGLGANF